MIQRVSPASPLRAVFEDMNRVKLNRKECFVLPLAIKFEGMDFLQELGWRGMIHQKIDGVEDYLSRGGQTGYIGFDPTADSLTIGNYVQVMILTHFQRAGHRPIALMGGATGRIGDPSGKSEERSMLDLDVLEANLQAQTRQLEKFLDFSGPRGAILENNFDFYKDMNALDYLRDLGKTLTINYMMSKDSVKNRLETGMSYTEFSYQLIQGYDFLYLYKKYGCALQMGGSDQWGNITTGTEFIRRSVADSKAYAITTPLLTKSDGSKFGKSESGNIWLSPDRTSPYQFYQFWVNAQDSDLSSFFRYFSLKDQSEIEALEREHADNPNAMKAILAEEITTRVHSEAASKRAQQVSQLMFGRKVDAQTIKSFEAETLTEVSREIPSFTVQASHITEGMTWSDILTQSANVFQSKGDFRRAVKGNALAINKVKLQDAEGNAAEDDILAGGHILIENGKKNKFMLILNG